ncbi:MAG: hypothetical protein ACMUIS_02135 [bacterium]
MSSPATHAVSVRGGSPLIDVTGKSIEASVREVAALIIRRLKEEAYKR